mmetsp:Transcript_18932/g.45708  ORF Transcript_18932/g.45708 Transcript_18932/m.45708 type:complete len:693 (+) Transcript_18932:198-2276(+)|eukprot:CAMPEP_0113472966 /NCGR_PEP_ID=MMETSP0014_2-20120614/17795_1 /TAXON_ID=2857 /ORGANISM="Nitzschia sp." /LENGTH=692 /DNA_ID=CAMNT_0000365707 /DNA_START=103 /DNA_END=2181 /DNA_ORIENTATION=- /assembly_acc=CAM_ASM_000159
MTDIPPLLPDDLIQQHQQQQQQNGTTTTMMNGTGNASTKPRRQQQQQSRRQQQQHDDDNTSHPQHEEEVIMRQIHEQQQRLIQQEESVLAEILLELDRERHRRAEMEAKVRVLEEELQNSERRRKRTTETHTTPSSTTVRDITRVEAERDGYKQIVEALTNDRPAFSTSMKYHSITEHTTNDTTTTTTSTGTASNTKNNRKRHGQNQNDQIKQLPIHIVRLLEVMPWDPRAQSYVFGHEQVYEWQVMGSADKSCWKKELYHFPTFFKSLPITLPSNGKTIQQQQQHQHQHGGFMTAAGEVVVAPPKRCVLTNLDVTQLLNIDHGYPLPEDGGDWMWISNWRVEKTNDTDLDGWSYSNDYQIMASSTYYNEFIQPTKGQPAVVRRRRKWTRRRMLFNYPYASTMTQEYLKLLSQKAILDVTLDKLSCQLVDTKMGLTTIEAERFAFEERTNARIRQLEQHGIDEKNNNRMVLGMTDSGSKKASAATPNTKKPDQIAAEIGSAVQQWVSSIGHQHHRKQDNSHDASSSSAAAAAASTAATNGTTNHEDGSAVKTTAQEKSIDGHTPKSSPSMAAVQQPQQKDPPAISPPHSPKSKQHQLLFDSLRGKGTDFFEKFKQNAEQEIDKFKKHGLSGNSSHDDKKSNIKADGGGTSEEGDGDNGTGTAATTTNASNVYVPATKKKLETSTYNHSTFED